MPVTGDLRPGGRYQIEGNASGTVERCDPPEGFTATWEFGGQTSWIEVRLTGEPRGGTRLELEHIAAPGTPWAEFGPGAVGVGWDMGLMGLATHLAPGQSAGPRDSVDPQDSAAWMTSAPGREFITLSSRRWRDADVAAGTDETAAQAAADRTMAAYTGSGG
ncbi:MAG: SRPBCC domain-containing protein [Streptosporangiaceae bacterium]